MEFTILDVYHILAAGAIILGLIACFAGYRFFRLLLAIGGFIISLTFGFVLVYYFISPNIIAATVVGSVLATIGSIVLSQFFTAGAFLLGSFFGGSLSVVFISLASPNCILNNTH